MITTPAGAAICRCGQPLITGTAEGVRARCNPNPITKAGHITAILAAKTVYRLTRTGLVEITSDRINSRNIQGPTLVQHKCGDQWPPGTFEPTPEENAVENDTEGIPY
ncbi:hypothetical protein ACQEVZ_20195 [Dactylosporangium sp. CA-152071]|uniref:hypothetical protein n=1 Tax=Dactylosporangium sp. CA-152071 TaxID=3239933 RepID=UPI003D9087F7